MKSLTIAVDVDETVCDMLGAICARGITRDLNEDLLPEDITGWGLPKWMYDLMDSELYSHWAMPIKGARTAIRQLREDGHRVVFVTSCKRETTDAKLEWLIRWGFLPDNHTLRDFIAAQDKSLVAADVLVDDAPHNIEAFPGHTYLIDQPHNRQLEGYARLRDITDLPAAIERDFRDPMRLVRDLVPLAQELALEAGRDGITVTEVRKVALEEGILTGTESRTTMSQLGHLMRLAGLVDSGETRRSDLEVTHGNRQNVWFMPIGGPVGHA